MKRPGVIAFVVVGALVLAALAASAYQARTGHPGDPAVYAKIERTTDCGELRAGLARTAADAQRRYSRRSVDDLYEIAKSYEREYRERIDERGC